MKWSMLRDAPGTGKVLICNADEGDPGAYMNRNEIESDPHMLIEGMLIRAAPPARPKASCTCAPSTRWRSAPSRRHRRRPR
ncbi:MAG: hypothetical protein U1G05_17000 [Kiritimatiellia bacterium]